MEKTLLQLTFFVISGSSLETILLFVSSGSGSSHWVSACSFQNPQTNSVRTI